MADTYAIVTCAKTYSFWEWGNSRFGMWIPIRKFTVIDKKRQKKNRFISAMPGYAFVPEGKLTDMLSHAPSEYYARAMCDPNNGKTCICDSEELRLMQYTMNTANKRDAIGQPPPVVFKPGQKVQVVQGPFAGLYGTVEKVRHATVRVQMGKPFVTLPPEFLR